MKPKSLHDLDKISPWYVDFAFWRKRQPEFAGRENFNQNLQGVKIRSP